MLLDNFAVFSSFARYIYHALLESQQMCMKHTYTSSKKDTS